MVLLPPVSTRAFQAVFRETGLNTIWGMKTVKRPTTARYLSSISPRNLQQTSCNACFCRGRWQYTHNNHRRAKTGSLNVREIWAGVNADCDVPCAGRASCGEILIYSRRRLFRLNSMVQVLMLGWPLTSKFFSKSPTLSADLNLLTSW